MSRGRVYLILGVVLAVISGVMVFMTINGAKPKPIQTVPVLVANETIPPRTFVTKDNAPTLFTTANFPVDLAPPGILSDPTPAIDHVILGGMEKGTPVFLSDLSTVSTQGQTGLSINIPTSMVAVSIPITQVNAVGGAISPGDFVDVLVSVQVDPTQLQPTNSELATESTSTASKSATPTPKPTATPAPTPAPGGTAASDSSAKGPLSMLTLTTLQHVKVIAVGQQIDAPQASSATAKSGATAPNPNAGATAQTLTLLLAPQDALLVKYARDSGSIIDIALRRYDDQSEFSTKGVDLQYFLDHFGYHLVVPVGTPTPAPAHG
jgi:Flp pilus assembly protein CpaB